MSKICTQCQSTIADTQSFCGVCGSPAPKHRSSQKALGTILLCVALVLSLIVNCVLFFPQLFPKKIEGKGFSSPKAAITAYAKAMQKNDVEQMVSTFAVESYVANFDLEERISQTRSYQFYTEEVGLSNNSEHAEQINHYTRLAAIIKRIKSDYFVLTGVDHSKALQAFVGDSKEEDIQAFLQQLEYPEFDKKLSRIKIGDVLTKDDFDIDEDIYSDIIDYSYLDAEEFCDVAIEISFNGDLYYLFMLTAKLDGRWYNITSCSPLGLLCGADSSDGLMKQ